MILLKLYVDDLNQAGLCLPLGSKYVRGKLYIPGQGWRGRSRPGDALTYNERKQIEKEAEDTFRQGGTQDDREKASTQIYREIANEVKPKSIRMKEDTPSNHDNEGLPILDT